MYFPYLPPPVVSHPVAGELDHIWSPKVGAGGTATAERDRYLADEKGLY